MQDFKPFCWMFSSIHKQEESTFAFNFILFHEEVGRYNIYMCADICLKSSFFKHQLWFQEFGFLEQLLSCEGTFCHVHGKLFAAFCETAVQVSVGKNNIEIIGPSSLQSTIYVRSNYQMIILENFENCGAFSEIKF